MPPTLSMSDQQQEPTIVFPFASPSLLAQAGKNSPAMRETWVRSQDREDPLEKGTATHSSVLAWTQLNNFHFTSLLTVCPESSPVCPVHLFTPCHLPLISRAACPGAECLSTPDCSIFSSLLGKKKNLFQEAFLS